MQDAARSGRIDQDRQPHVESVVLTQNTWRDHRFAWKEESNGDNIVFIPGAIWSGDYGSGPELSLPVPNDRWMSAWSAHKRSHNISSYTQAAPTGCQSVWRKMLLGQTVFSLWQIPVHRKPRYYYFTIISGLNVFDFGKKKYCIPTNTEHFQWDNICHLSGVSWC